MRHAVATALSIVLLSCGTESVPVASEGPHRANIINGSREPGLFALSEAQMNAVGFLAHDDGVDYCSGVLIHDRVVATARHCVDGESPNTVWFGVGALPTTRLALLPVERIHQNTSTDFALLTLERPVSAVVDTIEPIAINRAFGDDWLERRVEAAGFGFTRSTGVGRFFAPVTIVEYTDNIVTVDGKGQHGFCHGDSGGPILWRANEASPPVVVGTEQWGDVSCVGRDHLTRMDAFEGWIDGIIQAVDPGERPACGPITTLGVCEEEERQWCESGYLHKAKCDEDGGRCAYLGPLQGYQCVPADCGNLSYLGACDGFSLERCTTEGVEVNNCAAEGKVCSWRDDVSGYGCAECIDCGNECANTLSSTRHCGSCNAPCEPPRATGACEAGTCVILECDEGFYDADGRVATGCEQPEPAPVDDGCAAIPATAWWITLLWVLGRWLRRRR